MMTAVLAVFVEWMIMTAVLAVICAVLGTILVTLFLMAIDYNR
jgi:hypothetical protein